MGGLRPCPRLKHARGAQGTFAGEDLRCLRAADAALDGRGAGGAGAWRAPHPADLAMRSGRPVVVLPASNTLAMFG